MGTKLTALTSALLMLVASHAVAQGVLTERNISFAMAKIIAETALETCRKDGLHVTVVVLDRAGNVRIMLRDDGAAPHTYENSQRKAYTALTFRAPSRRLAERLTKNPGGVAQVYLTGTSAAGGGLPIKVGDEVIGAVGVSGSTSVPGSNVPGGTRDEACSQAGINKVADQLK
jgi:uncharacterized protein GlcG (DUF336 family)